MANDAGSAFVDVLPEFGQFRRRLQSEMDSQLRRVKADIPVGADTRGFSRILHRDVDSSIGRMSAGIQTRLGGAFARVALMGGAAVAAVGLGTAFKSIIGGASDLNETISKSNTIFGDQGKAIEAWAGTAAKSFGQSKQGALDAAATFGNLFVQLGTGRNEAVTMSKQMVELASDFASFHNADPTDVIESMTAAFRGEYDAVQRYVPTINAASVEQQALKMGLAGSTKELTAQDKALATQKLLMEGAGAAVGDFARTSDGLANRQRILSAQLKDTRDSLGRALLPVAVRVAEFFAQVLPKAIGIGRGAVAQLKLMFGGLASAFSGEGVTSDGMVSVFERIGVAARVVADFLRENWKSAVAALVSLFAVWTANALAAAAATLAAAAPVIAVTAALAALAAGIVYAYEHWDAFRTAVDAVVDFLMGTVWPGIQAFAQYVSEQFAALVGWVRAHWDQISEAIGHVVTVIRTVIETWVAYTLMLWRTFGDEILAIARVVWDEIRTVVETAVNLVRGVIQLVLALINGEWGMAWDAIKGILSAAWEFIKTTVGNALQIVGQLIETALSALRLAWDAAWNGMKGVFLAVWDGIRNIIADALGFVTRAFFGAISGMLDIAGKLPIVGGKFRGLADDVREMARSIDADIQSIRPKTVTVAVDIASKAVSAVASLFASGGQVPGVGDGDTVPAMLTPGEFVLRKSAVKVIGVQNLEAMNALHFAEGGYVGLTTRLPDVGAAMSQVNDIVDKKARDLAIAWAKAHPELWPEGPGATGGGGGPGPLAPGGGRGGLTAAATALLDAVLARFPGQRFTSGYRSPAENARVGGAKNSDHMFGRAIDIAPGSNAVASFGRGWPGIKQVIWQAPGHYDHVHLATTMAMGGLITEAMGDALRRLRAAVDEMLGRAGGGTNRPRAALVQPPRPGHIAEDDPRWDWRTMGDRNRGVKINGLHYNENADGTLTRRPDLDNYKVHDFVPDPYGRPGWMVPSGARYNLGGIVADTGALLTPGLNLLDNQTGGPEPLAPVQDIDYERMARAFVSALHEEPPKVDVGQFISKSRSALKAYR